METSLMVAGKTAPKPVEETMTLAQRIAINSAPAWRPNKGDILIGRLLGVRVGGQAPPLGYGKYPVLVVDVLDASGEATGEYKAIHAFHTLAVTPIIAMLKDKTLIRGGDVTISYLGKRDKNKPNEKGEVEEYHDYYVEPGNGADKVLDMEDPNNFPF
jgi:hypothetical protein